MMRIAEYKQIDSETVTEEITVIDEDGNERTETITREKPTMGMVYRDMTAEEEAEAMRQQAEAEAIERNREPSAEERLAMMEDAFAELCEVVFNG